MYKSFLILVSATCASLTWLLKPQNEVLYKKLITFLHDRKTAPKWPLYKKLVHPTWFIHTHYLSTMTGEPTPFFSIKQLVFSALCGTQAPSKRRGNPNGDTFGCYAPHGSCTWSDIRVDTLCTLRGTWVDAFAAMLLMVHADEVR